MKIGENSKSEQINNQLSVSEQQADSLCQGLGSKL